VKTEPGIGLVREIARFSCFVLIELGVLLVVAPQDTVVMWPPPKAPFLAAARDVWAGQKAVEGL
jgi:hypothetical protein